MGNDDEDDANDKAELMFDPAAEMDMGDFPKGASMPVTDLYRRKHKTDSKLKALNCVPSFRDASIPIMRSRSISPYIVYCIQSLSIYIPFVPPVDEFE